MIFSKATGYGILALVYLASQPKNRLCGLEEISGRGQIPPVFLRKVLGELCRHRLLRSVKGIHGGYELARPPEAITLWEVFQLLEPDPNLDMCILGRGACNPDNACPLHGDWQNVRKDLVWWLEKRTISQLAVSAGPNLTGTSPPDAKPSSLILASVTFPIGGGG